MPQPKRKPRRDPYLDDAQAQSMVRYGPELSALTALLTAAQQTYGDRVRQAKSARQFTVGAVEQAVPAVKQAWQGAQQAVSPAFAAAGGIEAQALQARVGESEALARQQLEARRVSAIEGQGAAAAQALRELGQDKQKIGQRSVDLGREIGAFTTATAGEMRGADQAALAAQQELAARLGQQERNSVRSAGIDPDTGRPIPGGRLDPKAPQNKPKAPGWVSLEAQGAAADDVGSLQNFATKLKSAGVRRGDAAAALQVGQDEKEIPIYRTVKDPVSGKTKQEKVLNPDGTPKMKKVPAVPQAKSKLLLKAALDQVYDGHLSRETQRQLHARRIKIAPLGLTTFNEWLKTPEGQEWKRSGGKTRISRPSNPAPRNAPQGYRPGQRPGIG